MIVFITAESMKEGKVDEGKKNETVENTESPEIKTFPGKEKDDVVA
jgi:hypothetical protein